MMSLLVMGVLLCENCTLETHLFIDFELRDITHTIPFFGSHSFSTRCTTRRPACPKPSRESFAFLNHTWFFFLSIVFLYHKLQNKMSKKTRQPRGNQLDNLARCNVLAARSFSSLKQECPLHNICCCTLNHKVPIPPSASGSAHSLLIFS